jgi:charged multivesicular body protein 4
MNLFGKKKQSAAAPAPSPMDTIKVLRDNLVVLEKREEHIQKKLDQALSEAKLKAQKKDKNGALFALKRKKMYEQEISKLQGTRITLDAQILAIESAAVNIETFRAMNTGKNAMKAMRGNIDSDTVDEMMDDLQEEKDIHDAISEAISRPGQELFDDEELLNELAELDALEMEEQMLQTPKVPETVFNLPVVPNNTIQAAGKSVVEETDDERALRELEASMLA